MFFFPTIFLKKFLERKKTPTYLDAEPKVANEMFILFRYPPHKFPSDAAELLYTMLPLKLDFTEDLPGKYSGFSAQAGDRGSEIGHGQGGVASYVNCNSSKSCGDFDLYLGSHPIL